MLHVLAVVAVVAMVSLGFWQLRRLDERRDRNDLVEARMAQPAADIRDLAEGVDDPDDLRFRSVTATGTYVGAPVLVRATQGGVPGALRYDQLQLEDRGEGLWVLRGFGPAEDSSAAPSGEVTVEGIAIPVERLPRTSRRALDGWQDRWPGVVVQAADAAPPLTPVPTPELDEGPHLSYAVQWFLFAAVVVVGYPFLLRRRLRDDAAG